MPIQDSAAWLADYQKNLSRLRANAEAASASLSRVGGRAASPRGEVEVQVGPSGALTDLRLSPAARALEADALARLILATVHDAHRQAGARVVDIMTDYVGDGPALQLVRDHLPVEAAPAAPRQEDDYFANPGIIS
ncbi:MULTISPECIES: YbaB/EbfC family nucleoid-associated protein [Actinomycetes]|uniref:YbaB/EbfC family nucleoid-associated protein n=1 Tax=Actinomycetes TaxID=1760 RepID=UPI0001B53F57|nr:MULTISPECIES: YbaB/EbfC family nucleoid-associated protein [Actinomycetes]